MTKDRDREEQSNLQARGEEPSKRRDDNSSGMALKLARTDQQKQSSSPTDRKKKVDFVPVTKQAELKEKYLSSSSEQKLPSKKEHLVPTSNQSDIKDKLLAKAVEEGRVINSRGWFSSEELQNMPLPKESISTSVAAKMPREGTGKGTKDTSKSLEELLDIAVARKSMPRRRKQKQVDKVTGEDEVRVETDMKDERRDGTKEKREGYERKRMSYEDNSSKLDKRYEVEQKDSKRNEIDLNDERKVTAVGKLRIKKDGVESNDKGKHGQKQVRDTGSLNKMEHKLETDNNSLQRKKDKQRSEERRSRKDDVSQRNAKIGEKEMRVVRTVDQ
ncbi:hypothetical protein BSL78_28630 [Apostichopus japonicus]|uniref:Uncharacterized protein n=1 Tax=Stichopus japonicus TaxID=307972 RepID=A0A2G8JFM4_STIJA|nr:hypothetical protein BSL78_28630 [Apostichopus japonicus]